MKIITVVDHAGQASTFKADRFDVHEDGYLHLTADSEVVAVFAPPAWTAVYHQQGGM